MNDTTKRGKSLELDYFTELWTVKTNYYFHKLPKYIEENGEKAIEYKEVVPVYVWRKGIDWNGIVTWEVCPVDFSKPENRGKGWGWSLTVNDYIGKSYFLTKQEADAEYMKISEETRSQYEEIRQLKRLAS